MESIVENSPQWAQWLLFAPLGAVLVMAAITDWQDRKIYNWLTYPALIFGIAAHTLVFGASGLITGVITVSVVTFLGLFLLPLGWLGGGDIKLFGVIGATLGPAALFEVFFYSVFVGCVIGICLSAVNGYLWVMLKRLGRFLKSLFLTVTTRTNLASNVETDERAYLPFAIPILIGAVLATTDVYLQWPLFMDWVREGMAAIAQR